MVEWLHQRGHDCPRDVWFFEDTNHCDWWTDIGVPVWRSQHHVQREDYAVLIIQTCVVVRGVIVIVNGRVVCVAVRVGDDVIVAVGISRPMDVLHRCQREYADCQTEQCRQERVTHQLACYAMRQNGAT